MTTTAILSLIALTVFGGNIIMSLINLAARDEAAPQGLTWGVWSLGLGFLVGSWVV